MIKNYGFIILKIIHKDEDKKESEKIDRTEEKDNNEIWKENETNLEELK